MFDISRCLKRNTILVVYTITIKNNSLMEDGQ